MNDQDRFLADVDQSVGGAPQQNAGCRTTPSATHHYQIDIGAHCGTPFCWIR